MLNNLFFQLSAINNSPEITVFFITDNHGFNAFHWIGSKYSHKLYFVLNHTSGTFVRRDIVMEIFL